MKRRLLTILLFHLMLIMGALSGVTGDDSLSTERDVMDRCESGRMESHGRFTDRQENVPEALFDLVIQSASRTHNPSLRRIQPGISRLVVNLQKTLKKRFSFSLRKMATSISVAGRIRTTFPISSFFRTCDLYVFSFGHMLN